MISCKAIFKVCGRFNKAIVSSSASLLTRNMSDSRQLRFYDGRTGSEFNDQESAFNFVKVINMVHQQHLINHHGSIEVLRMK